MPHSLADTLTHLRVGNQTFLLTFYQDHRNEFAEWARPRGLAPPAAHELLRSSLIEFYDQVADGRLTMLPPDLRAAVYGLAEQLLAPHQVFPDTLPATEARRRRRLLDLFGQLGADCQQVLMFFYFRGHNLETVAGKMGFANATVGRLQKTSCLRRLYELHQS